jgi:hypothetical protein
MELKVCQSGVCRSSDSKSVCDKATAAANAEMCPVFKCHSSSAFPTGCKRKAEYVLRDGTCCANSCNYVTADGLTCRPIDTKSKSKTNKSKSKFTAPEKQEAALEEAKANPAAFVAPSVLITTTVLSSLLFL